MAFCFLRDNSRKLAYCTWQNLKFSFSEKATKMRHRPYGFQIYLVNVKTLRQIAPNFCGLLKFSEKLNFICAEINPLNEKLVNFTSVHCFESVQLSRPDDSKTFVNFRVSKKTKYHPYRKCQSPPCTRKIHRSKRSVPSRKFFIFILKQLERNDLKTITLLC